MLQRSILNDSYAIKVYRIITDTLLEYTLIIVIMGGRTVLMSISHHLLLRLDDGDLAIGNGLSALKSA